MPYRITKEFTFSASHCLTTLPEGHQCARVHGHNFIVKVELSADTLNEHGFVREFNELSILRDYIDSTLDHRHLNDVLGDNMVTSEQLAKHFYDWCLPHFPEITAVGISETPKIWAEYRP